MQKQRLLELAKERQADHLPPHFNLTDFHGGYYECDFVSPWTKSAPNIDAKAMLIGQDWSSSNKLEQPPNDEQRNLGQIWDLPTNRNLRYFLEKGLGITFGETYSTNLFPFIKRGAMNVRIPKKDLQYCAIKYALRQIEIVSPKFVICLGKTTFEFILKSAGLQSVEWGNASDPGHAQQYKSLGIYGLPHPSARGTANAGGREAVLKMWTKLKPLLNSP